MGKIHNKIPTKLKYELYEDSVQCHESDIDFINDEFKRHRGRKPLSLREDFGGTAALACDWTRQSGEHNAWAIDLDPEPIEYGKGVHYQKLNDEEKERMKYIEGNVLEEFDFKSDVTVAFNFSYFCFKKRQDLLEYFKKARASIKADGIFFVDIFGGSEGRQESVEETEHDDHTYFWDCDNFNPLTGEILYYIHFKPTTDGKMYRKVFTYDWRMWTPMEVREIMEEAGFSKTVCYWEGEDEDGDGDGNFFISEDEEQCESWVTYIAALA